MSSEPRIGVTKYTVYPTGWDECEWGDKDRLVVYVEQYPDTGRWRVYDGWRHGEILTRKGTWTRDRNQVRHLTRFDTADEAIEVALKHVDSYPFLREKILRGTPEEKR